MKNVPGTPKNLFQVRSSPTFHGNNSHVRVTTPLCVPPALWQATTCHPATSRLHAAIAHPPWPLAGLGARHG